MHIEKINSSKPKKLKHSWKQIIRWSKQPLKILKRELFYLTYPRKYHFKKTSLWKNQGYLLPNIFCNDAVSLMNRRINNEWINWPVFYICYLETTRCKVKYFRQYILAKNRRNYFVQYALPTLYKTIMN